MGQALGLLALQDRGPGLALSPGAARRFSAITNPTSFFFLPTTVSDRFLLLFDCFFVRIESSKTVTTSAEQSKCASNRGQLMHSQPVLKKLVCETSTFIRCVVKT